MKARFAILFLLATTTTGCALNPLGSDSFQNPGFHPGLTNVAPQITSVSPSSGDLQGGTLLTILGIGFQSGIKVLLDAQQCNSVTWVSETKVTCITPSHSSGAVRITLVNPDLQVATMASAFTFVGAANSVAGMGFASGGGISSGPGVRLRFTIGGVGNPAQQSGTGVGVNTGLQGTFR